MGSVSLRDGFWTPVLIREDGDEAAGYTVCDRVFGNRLFVDFELGAEVVGCGYLEGFELGAAGGGDLVGVGAAVEEIVVGGVRGWAGERSDGIAA